MKVGVLDLVCLRFMGFDSQGCRGFREIGNSSVMVYLMCCQNLMLVGDGVHGKAELRREEVVLLYIGLGKCTGDRSISVCIR